jgi:outer membrane protein OmpA-like peptidoglycan-associated protein
VPTGEVLSTGDFSISGHRTEEDFRQGNTNVSSWPLTGAVGLPGAEVFGALRMITRIDRDTTPLLFANAENEVGGLVNEYPTVRDSWTGNKLGDLYLGAKFSLLSQGRQQPFALAARGTAKLPTGDEDSGAGTGEYDWFADLIASGEFKGIELTGSGGIAWRGDPDDLSISDGIRWGAGASFPARSPLRVTTEVFGEWMFDEAVMAPAGLLIAEDGSLSPAESRLKDKINTAVGITWQHPSGVLLGAAFSYEFGLESDPLAGVPNNTGNDAIGIEFRIGFHDGVRTYVPPPPAVAAAPPAPVAPAVVPPPPEPPPAPPANRGPVVRAACEPCTVQSGATATLRAEASDPDGDTLIFQWSATAGTLADTRAMMTTWRAETAPGLVTFTVAVDDGRGGIASDTVTIDVTDEGFDLEDVHFDFDSYQLRRDVMPALERAISALKQHPDIQLEIEGHTCNIGTHEYNLALGERRANAVRQYLVQRGISSARLTTVTYGEERPVHDNAQESTRRLNRRAVFVVRITDDEHR